MKLVHASDLHFGKPHLPVVRAALERFIEEASPDAVVISGDLTQRAKVREFEAARQFLDGLAPLPVVKTLGNHDVPVYRVFERLLSPYANYRKVIDPELDTITDLEGARIVALNTAAPYTHVVNGRLRRSQFEFADNAFETTPAGWHRILTIHHHVIGPGDFESDRPLPDATSIIRAFHRWGVDLVLSGHLHRSFVKTSDEGLPAGTVTSGIPIVHAGTATSSRGRGKEQGRNSFNLVRVEESEIDVSVYLYSGASDRFVAGSRHRYPRRLDL